jgi:hypothetical protein
MRTREEHVEWCKQLARKDLDRGDLQDACATMMGRMAEHPECGVNPAIAALGIMYVMQDDAEGVRRWVEGFR